MITRALVLGCFDLTHAGHFHLFECAKKIADEVHVGVASDSLVRAFKGEDRPIYSLRERMWIIQRCRDVDFVHDYGIEDSTKADNENCQKLLVDQVNPMFFVEGADKKGVVLKGYLERRGILRVETPRLSEEVTTGYYIKKIRESTPKKMGLEGLARARGDVSPYYYPR